MGARRTAIDAVEAIYADIGAVSPMVWLRRVLDEVHACVPGVVGGFAYAYDIGGSPSHWKISFPIVANAPPMMADHIFDAFAKAPPAARMTLLPRLGPAGTYSAVTGALLTAHGAAEADKLGVKDAIHVNALDADDRGVLVALTIREPRRLAPTEVRRLSMLAAHLAGARRLLGTGQNLEPDAIFETSGKIAHVEAPQHERAVDALRARLLRIEKLRSTRADADEELATWQALVSGTYTLLSRFDTDGRRYVVAYANPPGVRDPRGLTPLEAAVASWARRGHPQKLIGYELGLSVGTVGGILARVFRKLGVSSHAELVARLEEPEHLARVQVDDTELLLFSALRPVHTLQGFPELTPSECEVAEGAIAGKSTASIASERGCSPRTVTNLLARAFRKLGVSTRAELTARVRRKG